MHFDKVIANPPFKNAIKFMNMMNAISDSSVILAPDDWFNKPILSKNETEALVGLKSIEQVCSANEFRKAFNTRMELSLSIFTYDNTSSESFDHSAKEVKISGKTIADVMTKYNPENKYFIFLTTQCNRGENFIRFKVVNGKPEKVYDSNIINDTDTVLDVINRRRARGGKEAFNSYDEVNWVGINCENEDELNSWIEYLETKHNDIAVKYHSSHTPGYKFVEVN